MEGLDEMYVSVYGAAVKLASLQKRCHMDVVSVRLVTEAVDAQHQHRDVGLTTEDVSRTLVRMFASVGGDSAAAPEEIGGLVFRLYDGRQTGRVSAAAFQTALIALSADSLLDKYRALVNVSQNRSGSVSRSGLRSVLQDLSQVPAAVQEEAVFGSVEVALTSCFNGVSTATVSREHVLSWLQSSPRLLLWLPTLYRLSLSQNITHTVRCHTCKTFPITGLRYRCIKCVNVHVCQSCFLNNRQSKKHKVHHPVLEFCSQPTWKESLSSVLHRACYALLPRRRARRSADWRPVLTEPGESPNSDLPPDVSTQVTDSTTHHSSSRDASQRSPSCSSTPKAQKMDKEILTQQVDPAALLNEVRNLHRDKWLLEQELQAWRLTVRSETGLLEDRCSEMEVNMEGLRQHHLLLQGMLTQALNKEPEEQTIKAPHGVDTETLRQPDDTSHGVDTHHAETGNTTPTSDTQDEDEERQATPSPTIRWDDDLHYEESVGERCLCHPVGGENEPETPGLQEDDTCPSEEEDEEKLLQETVDRLKAVMETDRRRERQKGERTRAELLEAADQVGGSVHQLVDAVSR